MNWLIFVAITLLADSFRIFLDNYVSDFYFKGRGAASQKIFFHHLWRLSQPRRHPLLPRSRTRRFY